MDMEKILGVVFSHPLQMLASLLLAGVSIQVLGARIEGTPLPKQRIILAFVVMVAVLTGCSTPVLQGVVAGGLVGGGARALGASHDLALGAGIITAAIVAADTARHERAIAGHQRQLPSYQAEWKDKAACQSAGGQPIDTGVFKDNGTPVWHCRLACSDAGHQVAGATRPTFGKLYNVRAHPGWQNYLWCVGPEGVVVKADPRVGEYLYPCSPETTRNFWKR